MTRASHPHDRLTVGTMLRLGALSAGICAAVGAAVVAGLLAMVGAG